MRYRQSPFLLAIILLLLLFAFGQGFRNPAVIGIQKNNTEGFAVIELFTSEGCSSCPAADAAVEQFLKENTGQIYVLAFHVDYWDKLGWKDIFSKAAYSARQQKYASVFHLQSVYTPQTVVNGRHELVGSNSIQLKRVVEKELTNGEGKPVKIHISSLPGNRLLVNYQLNEKINTTLNIALVQLHAASDVKRGENEGRHLEHINVVRDFKTIPVPGISGKMELEIPAGISKTDCKIIAYLQDAANLQIVGVAEAGTL